MLLIYRLESERSENVEHSSYQPKQSESTFARGWQCGPSARTQDLHSNRSAYISGDPPRRIKAAKIRFDGERFRRASVRGCTCARAAARAQTRGQLPTARSGFPEDCTIVGINAKAWTSAWRLRGSEHVHEPSAACPDAYRARRQWGCR